MPEAAQAYTYWQYNRWERRRGGDLVARRVHADRQQVAGDRIEDNAHLVVGCRAGWCSAVGGWHVIDSDGAAQDYQPDLPLRLSWRRH